MTRFPHIRLEYAGPGPEGRTRWLVIEPMWVGHQEWSGEVGDNWITDLASVPRLPLTWLLAGGDAPASAVTHDWLYRMGPVPRAVADRVFRDLITREGYSSAKAWMMWTAVRLGGWSAWNRYRAAGR
jgi:hypothetical protein